MVAIRQGDVALSRVLDETVMITIARRSRGADWNWTKCPATSGASEKQILGCLVEEALASVDRKSHITRRY